jgi:hypothetical protein
MLALCHLLSPVLLCCCFRWQDAVRQLHGRPFSAAHSAPLSVCRRSGG